MQTNTVATFTSTGSPAASSYTASINWGDGSAPTAGTIGVSGGTFSVTGSHAYRTQGVYGVSVSVQETNTSNSAVALSAANVADLAFTATAAVLGTPLEGTAASTFTLATVNDTNTLALASDYTAVIRWGDGTTSAGEVRAVVGQPGRFDVLGTHLYDEGGPYTIDLLVVQAGGTSKSLTPSTGVVQEAIYNGAHGTQVQNYINEVYQSILNRPADSGGLGYWASVLGPSSTEAQRASFVQNLTSSTEYRQIVVQAMYQKLLHRAADPGGLSSWTNFLATGTVEQMAASLAESAEYYQNRASNLNEGFVNALYHDVFGRGPDAGSLGYWTNRLATGSTRLQVATEFFTSTEYRENLVKGWYLQFLERPAPAADVSSWVSQLAAGVRDETVIVNLVKSTEFYNKPGLA